MSQIEAISFEEVECGKKIEGTKKRFRWKFNVGGTSYTMELVSSTLSGKRVVTLNSQEIHSEQSIFNIDFDFTHQIEGHTFRITRVPDTINTYEMRIDNQTFQQIKDRHKFGIKEEKDQISNEYRKTKHDPFSDFGDFAKPANPTTSNNQFGQFDFDAFSRPPAQKIQTVNSAPMGDLKKKDSKPKNSFQEFDFSKPTPPSYEQVNFQTNFQTNKNTDNNINFFENFNKFNNETAHDQDAFATGVYSRNSMYSDLVFQKPEQKSDWSDFGTTKEEPKSAGFKIQMSAKQVFNKVKMTAEELKMKISGQDQSLI